MRNAASTVPLALATTSVDFTVEKRSDAPISAGPGFEAAELIGNSWLILFLHLFRLLVDQNYLVVLASFDRKPWKRWDKPWKRWDKAKQLHARLLDHCQEVPCF